MKIRTNSGLTCNEQKPLDFYHHTQLILTLTLVPEAFDEKNGPGNSTYSEVKFRSNKLENHSDFMSKSE